MIPKKEQLYQFTGIYGDDVDKTKPHYAIKILGNFEGVEFMEHLQKKNIASAHLSNLRKKLFDSKNTTKEKAKIEIEIESCQEDIFDSYRIICLLCISRCEKGAKPIAKLDFKGVHTLGQACIVENFLTKDQEVK